MRVAKKQMALLSLATLLLLILAWQISRLMHDDISYESVATASATAAPQPVLQSSAATPPATPATSTAPAAIETKTEAPAFTPLPKEENDYLELLNKYKFAKLRHRLMDEELAIATSRDRISKLNHDNETFSSNNNDENNNAFGISNTKATQTKVVVQPKLVYLDIQNGAWSATLNIDDHYEQITAGVVLSDGSKIESISQSGVIIESKNKERFNLSFNGITPLTNTLAAVESIKAAPSVPMQPLIAPQNLTTTSPSISTPEITPSTAITTNSKKTVAKSPSITISKITPPTTITNNSKQSISTTTPKSAPISIPKSTSALISKPTSPPHSVIPQQQPAKPPVVASEKSFHPYVANTKSTINLPHHRQPQVKPLLATLKKNPPAKLTKDQRHHTLDETVLLEMPAKSFTIKLRDSSNKQQLTEFAKQHHIEDRTLCYSHAQNPTLYTLVYGDYLTSTAAHNAIQKLTETLSTELTIEPLQKIQHDIIG